MSTLRVTPLYRALYRPSLLLGGERELVLFTGLVAGGLIVSAMNLIATLVGLLVWFGCIGVLRSMAKFDPDLSKIYLRQLRYQACYPARSTPWIKDGAR